MALVAAVSWCNKGKKDERNLHTGGDSGAEICQDVAPAQPDKGQVRTDSTVAIARLTSPDSLM